MLDRDGQTAEYLALKTALCSRYVDSANWLAPAAPSAPDTRHGRRARPLPPSLPPHATLAELRPRFYSVQSHTLTPTATRATTEPTCPGEVSGFDFGKSGYVHATLPNRPRGRAELRAMEEGEGAKVRRSVSRCLRGAGRLTGAAPPVIAIVITTTREVQ